MIKNKQNLIAIFLVILFGISLFYVGTDGFKAYTAETARTNKLMEEKPKLPLVTLEDSNKRSYSFSEFEGKYVLMTFIYTSCTDVCLQLEVNAAEVYNSIPQKYIGEDIVFLSISFDPVRDTPDQLDKYRSYFKSDGETWRMARIPNQKELDTVLDELGVIVIPDGNGNFTHNSAFYLAGPDGKLLEVMDYKKTEEAAKKVTDILDNEVEG
ncbi:SCO family protein [Virgibacillus halodenitrificans]|uniref:SCO family protein n=1 Tax=Virgibacillus halodenitrificans TaxID=1482 RepID=UPI00045C6057|nr:SCO family protein [Virgibacillus halodenitrificans]MCG1029512.1 SCO family protein [Virgibacillus halodenitrificans]CDQ32286.1 BsSco [Virgibacillus halodenitrificans]